MNALERVRARRIVQANMARVASRVLRVQGVEPTSDELRQISARWTEELFAAKPNGHALPDLPKLRQYDDPEILKAAEALMASVGTVLDELYAAVVGGIDAQLSQDGVTNRAILQVEGGERDGGEADA